MDPAELTAWLRLAMAPGIGNVGARRLLAAFGLPQAIFAQSAEALEQVLPGQSAALLDEPENLAAQPALTLEWLAGSTPAAPRRILTLGDPDYPASLLETEDPPLMLYLLGRGWDPGRPAIAVVGSRNPTPQGLENARRFARSFAEAGLTVVSGLALGIDGAAHEGALDGAAPGMAATVAVVGTGLDRVYPSRHRELAHRIAQQGLLVSEYALGTPPLGPNFPRRNRIISALARGTLVVEAALKSGSLITARMAAEQGREVFAIPGSIHSPQSRGCHLLLRQGAKLVESAQDVLDELRWPSAAAASTAGQAPAVPESGSALLAALGYDPVSLDALIARTGIPAPALQARLLEMELEGALARLPGGLFQRVGSA